MTDGKSKTLKPEIGFALVWLVMLPTTKSPSNTMAAFCGVPNTWVTEAGKSVCSAPCVPPATFCVSPRTCAMVVSAAFTDGSVQGILCWESWSYLAAPACRR